MFGTKQSKWRRQEQIVELLRRHYPEGLTVPELARMLDVPNSTILRDLPDLEDQQVFLDEDRNRLRIAFQDW